MNDDWNPVGEALLGSWPSQVASWGPEAIAAFLNELRARGVSAEAALVAIRSCPAEQRFPPSAPELAALARRDPSRPTFGEAVQLIFGSGGVLKARTSVRKSVWAAGERERLNGEAMQVRAERSHPLVAAFVRSQGLDRLCRIDLDDPEFGLARRRQLEGEWERFLEANEGREVASIAAGRRGELVRFDPLTMARPPLPELDRGSA